MKIKLYIFLLFSASLFAQKVETSIDTTKNKIGAQFNLTLKTVADSSAKVVFPKGNNFGAMEVIRSYVVDTVVNGSQYELIKKYGLAQFDSGRYSVPQLKVQIGNQTLLTDSISVEVSNVVVDTLKQKMYDIKPIAKVKSSNSWIWYVLLILVALVAVGVGVYFLMRQFQNKKIEEKIYKSPIEKATNLLKNLEQKELWQKGEIKAYYSELTDIARNYIEEAIEIPAMESTTSELILGLRAASLKKRMKVSKETLENLELVLKQADLVKFAKSKPLDFEIAEDKKKIEKAIFTLDNAIPQVTEDEGDVLNEAQRQKLIQQKLKKKKNTRIAITIISVVGAAFAILIFYVATKGFDFVKDNILGHPTKELLKGEWVSSEYGNPGIYMETPRVLKRLDSRTFLPPEAFEVVKEMQLFGYGSLTDNFNILLSTQKFKDQRQMDLPIILESMVRGIEAKGAQNMILKQEEFSTKEGLNGMKGYGTFSRIDATGKTSTKMYYEILVFGQEGGLQQITIQHEEGDEYGNEIAERILNSVELKKATP